MECLIALTQGWTVRVDSWWYPRLRGYRWQALRSGHNGRWRYAARSIRVGRGHRSVSIARVIMGCQDLDTGDVPAAWQSELVGDAGRGHAAHRPPRTESVCGLHAGHSAPPTEAAAGDVLAVYRRLVSSQAAVLAGVCPRA